jgi:PP-loop superfamily ATP-utilizing enzyme
MIERAEEKLADLGLRQLRVRCHGNLAASRPDEEGYRLLSDRSIRKRYIAFSAKSI